VLDEISRIQKLLENTARSCLRLLRTEQLNASQRARLEKFMFACMLLMHDLPGRFNKRGDKALAKALEFYAAACELLNEIDVDN